MDGQDEPLGSFIFRTSGFNSIRTLTARLEYFAAFSGGLLSALPLALVLRAKSTVQSYRTPVYYVDLTLRSNLSLEETVREAKEQRQSEIEGGLDRAALEHTAAACLSYGAFEEDAADAVSSVDECVPGPGNKEDDEPSRGDLVDKLAARKKSSVSNELPSESSRNPVG